MTRSRAVAILVMAMAAALGVGKSVRAPGPTTNPRAFRILFIGNSLTASNDLPAIVQAIARSKGVAIEIGRCAPGGFNLEDHWNHRDCRDQLERGTWDVVVLQQGPSSRPENAADLKKWAITWGDAIRARGATPALYMVWPFRNQKDGFRDVSNAYRAAAEAAHGTLIAAGDAWRDVEAGRISVALYSKDGLHPTLEGSYLAALVVARELCNIDPSDVPDRLTLASGKIVMLKPTESARLRDAAGHATTPSTRPR